MGEEITENLLTTLENAIEEAKSSEQILFLSKLAPLHPQFVDLKESLAKPNSSITPSQRKEKLYYLINVLNEWQRISKRSSSCSPQALLYAYNLSRRLKKVRNGLKGGDASGSDSGSGTGTGTGSGAQVVLPQTTQSPGGDDVVSPPSESETYRGSSRYVDPEKVYGVEDKALLMERLLLRQGTGDNTFRAIGIVGVAGIGKTALCQLIFSRAKVKEHFLPRIWVSMWVEDKKDVDNNKKEIVKRMLTCLGVEDEFIDAVNKGHGLRGLVFALRLQLMNKRYLIVLDDAWDNNEFYQELDSVSISDERRDHLSFGLPKGCGGTVIVTSRAKEVAKNMVSEENLHFHQLLSDHDSCWKIFKDAVEKDGSKFPPELENLRDEIVRKCGGLPLAARMMGQIAHEQLRPGPAENRQESQ